MCARFAAQLPPEFVRRLFKAQGKLPNLGPNWNVVPTQPAMVIRRHLGAAERRLDVLRRGLDRPSDYNSNHKAMVFAVPNSESGSLPPRYLARAIGIISLAGIATGAFDIGYVQNALIDQGNAAATLRNIASHEGLFRLGYSAHVLELLLNVFAEVLGFVLLRRVNGVIAAIALGCGFVGIAIEAVSLLFAYLPMLLTIGNNVANEFPNKIAGMVALSLKSQQAALLLSWVFYGVDELATGCLFVRSAFIPRVLGLMLALSGLCYFFHGMLSFLAPSLDAALYPYIILPNLPGEGLSSLWLAVVGLSISRWAAWTAQTYAHSA